MTRPRHNMPVLCFSTPTYRSYCELDRQIVEDFWVMHDANETRKPLKTSEDLLREISNDFKARDRATIKRLS